MLRQPLRRGTHNLLFPTTCPTLFSFLFSPLLSLLNYRLHSFFPPWPPSTLFPFFCPPPPQVHIQSALNTHHMRNFFAGDAEKFPQIQCSDYTWVAFEHCEAAICSYGSC